MNHAPNTANATFAATLCDQWWIDGLRAAFVAPGSRSTPLALALLEHGGIGVEIFHDERSAAFAALGYALAADIPGVVLCSSGTAGAHFYAAAIEAEASAVPMIICTADRPPELWGRGAPQTIDQTNLFGDTVLDFVEPGPPEDTDPASWRPLARQLWTSATGSRPGPVHANLSFRDPLTGTPGELPPPVAPLTEFAPAAPDPAAITEVADRVIGKRGVLVVGRNESDPADLIAVADQLGWPIVGDHRSGCRSATGAVHYFDALLRESTFTDGLHPEVVVRVGEIVSSKSTSQWLSTCGADVIATMPHGRMIDPEDVAQLQLNETGVIAALRSELSAARGNVSCHRGWREHWLRADATAARTVERLRVAGPTSDEELARRIGAEAPPGSALVVSSSMPVRDIEWYGGPLDGVTVIANRGANGIDGVVATAIGVALTGAQTTCLIGDVAFLHDASSLTALAGRDIDLTIVVVDNDGGAIFSFLPQRKLLDPGTFETLFGTPHGTAIAELAGAHNLPVRSFDITKLDDIESIYWPEQTGPRVVVAHSEREANRQRHDDITTAIGVALRGQAAAEAAPVW